MTTIGLVRLTVAAPRRRVDIALPEHAPVAEFAPALLQHAGAELADDGAQHGGWSLRRADGTTVDLGRTLAAQQIRDGEVLHLVPAGGDWPELEYDDLVDAIAGAARRRGLAWGPSATRRLGLGSALAALLAGLVVVARSGPPWHDGATYLGFVAVVLLLAGTVLARALGDAGAGSVLGAAAVVYAAGAGALLPADGRPLSALGAPSVLAAGAALVVAGLAGYGAIADGTAVFAGAAGLGMLAAPGAWLGTTSLGEVGAAAVLGAGVVVLLPAVAPLAMRLGRLPRPALPRSAADLLSDAPLPARSEVHAAVVRSDALLTGLLMAAGGAVAACEVLLVRSHDPSARYLTMASVAALLLRSRLLPAVRHRAPLLVAGGTGLAALLFGAWHADPLTTVAPATALAAAAAVAAALRYARHRPGAYVGRYAEIAELLVGLTLLPLTCSVLGLFAHLRGLGG